MNVVCVGDCGVDHYLPANERFFGGISANFARHARREFHRDDVVQLISCVGDDEGAGLVLSSLADSAIECHISKLPGATPVQYIEVQPDGERKFVRYEEGVLREFRIGNKEMRIIRRSDLLVAPVYLQIAGLFDHLMNIGSNGLISIDFADFLQHPDFALLEKHIGHIDIGFFGLNSGDTATIGQIGELARQHDKLFVVTLGAAGSRAYFGGDCFDCPAAPVDTVVDTTGAGDAFAAGFLGSYCHGVSVPGSLHRGAQLAAQTIVRKGAGQEAGKIP
jgi:sugar/nucleoside kinase (ribokinase family)